MTTKADELNALADQCEREEPSRELDEAIAFAVFDLEARLYSNRPRVRVMWLYRRGTNDVVFYGASSVPAYTTSLDAAVSLVPENWALSLGEMRGLPERIRRRGWLNDHNTPDGKATRWREGNSSSPSLAICAAALRARASIQA
jgi:hypothetical protein